MAAGNSSGEAIVALLASLGTLLPCLVSIEDEVVLTLENVVKNGTIPRTNAPKITIAMMPTFRIATRPPLGASSLTVLFLDHTRGLHRLLARALALWLSITVDG